MNSLHCAVFWLATALMTGLEFHAPSYNSIRKPVPESNDGDFNRTSGDPIWLWKRMKIVAWGCGVDQLGHGDRKVYGQASMVGGSPWAICNYPDGKNAEDAATASPYVALASEGGAGVRSLPELARSRGGQG